MNVTDYTYLINKPGSITEKQTLALDKVLEEFPYFQSARAIRLKGLYNENSFKYNSALKVTAAHTTDRAVLFDFISSDDFNAIQKELFEKKINELLSINVIDSIEVVAKKEVETILKNFETSSTNIETTKTINTAEENLQLGKPLEFSKFLSSITGESNMSACRHRVPFRQNDRNLQVSGAVPGTVAFYSCQDIGIRVAPDTR